MDIKNFDDCFCPILTRSLEKPVKCQENCQWRNAYTKSCDINVIADILLKDPDALSTQFSGQSDEA